MTFFSRCLALGSLVLYANTRIQARGGSLKGKFLTFRAEFFIPFLLRPTAVRFLSTNLYFTFAVLVFSSVVSSA